jgi:undecaprenyl phosphate-alpha-L-ara4N flippase subunit ArnE
MKTLVDLKGKNARHLLLIIPLSLIVGGQILSKLGVQSALETKRAVNLFVLLAYGALFLRGASWFFLLKSIKVSYAYPLMSVSYFFILLISLFVFKESLTAWNIAGTFVIVIGVVLMSADELKSGAGEYE